MDLKALPTHMVPTRDPPQNKRPTQTESEGLEKNIPSESTGKKKKKVLWQYIYPTKHIKKQRP